MLVESVASMEELLVTGVVFPVELSAVTERSLFSVFGLLAAQMTMRLSVE